MLRQLSIMGLIAGSLTLSGCHFMYRQDISQGNLISQYQAKQIKRGMSIKTVVNQLGSPVLKNIYPSNRLIYAYSLKPGFGDLKTKRLIVTFKNNRVTQVTWND